MSLLCKQSTSNRRIRPLLPGTRNNTEVRQRVLSARRLRAQSYQNQLNELQQTISNLLHENRLLRTLQKRQNSALAKYEATNAELPMLLHSHDEELRYWQTKYRNLQAANKELEQKYKQKEAMVLALTDQNKFYCQLNRNKNLEDRQRLTEKVQLLETMVREKENDIKLMARRMQLDAKQFKQQLQGEQKKNKEAALQIEKARLELSNLRKFEELSRTHNNEPKQKLLMALEKEKLLLSECSVIEDSDFALSQRFGTNKDIINLTHVLPKTAKNDLPSFHKSSTENAYSKKPQEIELKENGNNTKPIIIMPDFTNNLILSQKDEKNIESVEKQVDNIEKCEKSENHDTFSSSGFLCNKTDVKVNNKCLQSLANFKISEDLTIAEDNISIDPDKALINFKEQIANTEFSANTEFLSSLQKDISGIRKHIFDDYKGREAFLDTFCRQANIHLLQTEKPNKRNSVSSGRSQRQQLLAAVKAIDDNRNRD